MRKRTDKQLKAIRIGLLEILNDIGAERVAEFTYQMHTAAGVMRIALHGEDPSLFCRFDNVELSQRVMTLDRIGYSCKWNYHPASDFTVSEIIGHYRYHLTLPDRLGSRMLAAVASPAVEVPKRTVRIQVIRSYDIEVEASNDDAAISSALAMQSTTIESQGNFIDVITDYAEIVEINGGVLNPSASQRIWEPLAVEVDHLGRPNDFEPI